MEVLVPWIVYGVCLLVLYAVLDRIHAKDRTDPNQSDERYTVTTKVLRPLGMMLFWFGLALFVVFLVLMLCGITGQGGATPGHLVVFGILALIGLMIYAWAVLWRLEADGTQLTVHRPFHRTVTLDARELSQVKLTRKGQLELYRGGKRLMIVDVLAENRDRLEQTLKSCGKEPAHRGSCFPRE